jgi:hypothetical protein
LNKDSEINWPEFSLVNGANKKSDDHNGRIIFIFLDKNNDWKISAKEFSKAKVKDLLERKSKDKAKKKK